MARKKSSNSTEKSTEVQPFDNMVSEVVGLNRDLRLMKIARLEMEGFSDYEIAKTLGWQLELVLLLQGKGVIGSARERENNKSLYEAAKDRASQASLVDVEAHLSEIRAKCLMTMEQAMDLCESPKDRALIAEKLLKLGGTGADYVEKHVLEVRMPTAVVESLKALNTWVAPKGKLDALIEAEVVERDD